MTTTDAQIIDLTPRIPKPEPVTDECCPGHMLGALVQRVEVAAAEHRELLVSVDVLDQIAADVRATCRRALSLHTTTRETKP